MRVQYCVVYNYYTRWEQLSHYYNTDILKLNQLHTCVSHMHAVSMLGISTGDAASLIQVEFYTSLSVTHLIRNGSCVAVPLGTTFSTLLIADSDTHDF